MSEEMKSFDAFADEMPVPTLTLEPAIQEEKPLAETIQEKPEPKVEEPKLTPQEQKMVDDFAQQIDLTNSNLILQYGAGTQKKMADFSEAALANVQTQDLGEAGQLITELVKEHGIPAIFTEVNGSDATARAIARETGCRVAQLNMLMDGPEGDLEAYYTGITGNLAAILNGFAGEEVVSFDAEDQTWKADLRVRWCLLPEA